MSSGAVEPRETSNGAANLVLQSARALSSSSAQNGASKPVDLHLGAKRCVFIYKVLVGYEVQVEVSSWSAAEINSSCVPFLSFYSTLWFNLYFMTFDERNGVRRSLVVRSTKESSARLRQMSLCCRWPN